MKVMSGFLVLLLFGLTGLSVHAQTNPDRVAPGAEQQLNALLNKPAMVRSSAVTPLGKNWFRLETDAHIITNEVSFRQVAAVLGDVEHTTRVFDGKKSKLTGNVISRGTGGITADFVMIAIAPMGIQIKTPYRALVQTAESTESKIYIEIRQLPADSDANKNVKHLFATRYAQEITINGRTYTYIRIYAINEANASILPGAKGILENNTEPANLEALQLIISAAKTK
jgi:hypothetical protein